MKKFLLLLGLTGSGSLLAQVPQGYYDAASGLNGEALRTALHNIIDNHDALTYAQLWNAFTTTDKKANGKVWDIYSDVPGGTAPYQYTFGTDQCGNYNAEGDCYNREHSWPQSYFNSASPMVSDLFHIYPTDGFVNGKRSDLPYGKVTTSSSPYQSQNGSRSGPNTYPGYTGTVFEPIDSFKGDIARTYFYMSTRYKGQDGGWSNWAAANGADLKQWTIDLMLEWHHNDPVSAKELSRNNAIYTLQHNRNPFIDNPDYADCIWGTLVCPGNPPTSAIAGVNISSRMKIYPNPAVSTLTIEWPEVAESMAVDLLNLQGQLVWHKDMDARSRRLTLDIQPFAKGIYILRVQSATSAGFKKVVLQ